MNSFQIMYATKWGLGAKVKSETSEKDEREREKTDCAKQEKQTNNRVLIIIFVM